MGLLESYRPYVKETFGLPAHVEGLQGGDQASEDHSCPKSSLSSGGRETHSVFSKYPLNEQMKLLAIHLNT